MDEQMKATPAEIQRRIEAVIAARRRFFLAEPDAPTPPPVKQALQGCDKALAEFKRKESQKQLPINHDNK
jgi:hypothetical protein